MGWSRACRQGVNGAKGGLYMIISVSVFSSAMISPRVFSFFVLLSCLSLSCPLDALYHHCMILVLSQIHHLGIIQESWEYLFRWTAHDACRKPCNIGDPSLRRHLYVLLANRGPHPFFAALY